MMLEEETRLLVGLSLSLSGCEVASHHSPPSNSGTTGSGVHEQAPYRLCLYELLDTSTASIIHHTFIDDLIHLERTKQRIALLHPEEAALRVPSLVQASRSATIPHVPVLASEVSAMARRHLGNVIQFTCPL